MVSNTPTDPAEAQVRDQALEDAAADGWHTTVTRFPASAKPGYLATIRADRRIPVDPVAVRDRQAIRRRHTDRRPLPAVHIDTDKLRSIVTAAHQQGTQLQLSRPDQIVDLTSD